MAHVVFSVFYLEMYLGDFFPPSCNMSSLETDPHKLFDKVPVKLWSQNICAYSTVYSKPALHTYHKVVKTYITVSICVVNIVSA